MKYYKVKEVLLLGICDSEQFYKNIVCILEDHRGILYLKKFKVRSRHMSILTETKVWFIIKDGCASILI